VKLSRKLVRGCRRTHQNPLHSRDPDSYSLDRATTYAGDASPTITVRLEGNSMAIVSRARACTALLLAMFAVQACDSPRVDGPPNVTVSLAKAAANPSVGSATPASGHQGDVTLDVTITGSGFDNGSKAIWQLNGAPYSKITVNNTRFNSSTSLTATITIASDAVVANYDIAVVTTTGKKGIGAELFTVTYAVPVQGVTQGQAISDAGTVVGYNGTTVVATDRLSGVATVAAKGIVWDIDRAGGTIGGQNAAQKPVIWTSGTGAQGPWVETVLPDLGGIMSAVRGIASDANGNAVFLAGNSNTPDGKRHAVVWTRSATGWTLHENAYPPRVASIFAQSVNARGQSVGFDGSGCCVAAYWDSLGNATPLAALSGARNAAAWSINGDGTVAVGNSGTTAVLWWRNLTNGAYGSWSSAVMLEKTSLLCGQSASSIAYDINTAGTIAVGSSCGVAVAWKISNGVVTERKLLQGLGPPNQSVAYGISDAASPTATGSAKTATAVFWWGF
jgi:hypothetical protein